MYYLSDLLKLKFSGYISRKILFYDEQITPCAVAMTYINTTYFHDNTFTNKIFKSKYEAECFVLKELNTHLSSYTKDEPTSWNTNLYDNANWKAMELPKRLSDFDIKYEIECSDELDFILIMYADSKLELYITSSGDQRTVVFSWMFISMKYK